jgi:DNA-binding CsgD family transcriptional regulator
MGGAAERRHVDNLVQRCYAGLGTTGLQVEVLRRLRSMVSVDAAFFATLDPITLQFTSARSEAPLIEAAPLFLDNELGAADVNRFADLAAADDPVGSLDHATRGERDASRRFTEIMAPLGLGDELRVVLRSGRRSWGVLCLHRESAAAGFSEQELGLLRAVAPHVAEGLRRAQLLGPPLQVAAPLDQQPAVGTGIVILDTDFRLMSINSAAEHWISEIADRDWPATWELPLALYSAAARLNHIDDDQLSAPTPVDLRIRTAAGRWLVVRATRLEGGAGRQIAVLLEPASPAQLRSVLLAAHGLTPAQERVAALVLQGHSTRDMVDALHVSRYTVQEHLKAIFDKFGVRSRRELVAAVLGLR